jgi:hypothetical protein
MVLGGMRMLLFLACINTTGYASATSCLPTQSQRSLDQTSEIYELAEIVAYLEPIERMMRSSIYEVEVKRVWKGEIGERSYVHGELAGLAFLRRIDDGPLLSVADPIQVYCLVGRLGVDEIGRVWGEGRVPNKPNTELVTSNDQAIWLVSIIVGGGALMLVLVGLAVRWRDA